MDELLQLAKLHDKDMDEDYERFYRSFSTRSFTEQGYYYVQYKSCNTPSQRYCDICKRGFLTSNAKGKHRCDLRSRKARNGRYKCRTCLYETHDEWKMKKHNVICRKRSRGREIGLEYEIMTMDNSPYTRICPLCFKGFKSFTNRERHFKSCLQNNDRKRCLLSNCL